MGRTRHQAQEQPQGPAGQCSRRAERRCGQQPQDPGETGGQGGGAGVGGEEAPVPLPSHHERGRKVSGEIQGRE